MAQAARADPPSVPVLDGQVVSLRPRRRLVWRVLAVAAATVCLGAADAIAAAIAGSGITMLVLTSLGVPICGCAGGLRGHVPLLRGYIVCSVLGAASAVVAAGVVVIISIPTVMCLCDDVCFASEYQPGDRRSEASRSTWDERNAICQPGLDAILSGFRFELCVALALVGVHLVAAWLGRKLAAKVLETGAIPLRIPVAPVIALPGEPLPAFMTAHQAQPADEEDARRLARTGEPVAAGHASVASSAGVRVEGSRAPAPGHASRAVAPLPGPAYPD
ncbi:hypothetical protein FNF29_00187 [Cafeteria roenbergensis]|uniref:Uncharacterized protein n=1 Tax=Cafeteria roenbergensis TaxID=33653 RepID=A0A5A8D0V0_CAFRO|nr:hypothetical protein FNF29_00187 [Cafeteria roenbergensis]|eukprot:KAA0157611.1 hypothetical protein FNF29_00187 [Cafeteria roenbergensis]